MSCYELLYRLFLSPLKRTGEFLWYSRSWVPFLNFPIPWRLPYGAWFLAYGDAMGASIFGYKLARRPYEEGQWKFVSRFLKSGMTFFDIGANQGFYTMLGSKRIGSQGRVFAFEPAPTEFNKLRKNLLINRCRNVVSEPYAVGTYEGFTEFYLCLEHQGSFSSIRQPADDVISKKKLIEVPITTLDGYVHRNNISSVDFIKIDVEGGELDVLKGGGEVIDRLRPIIMCEIEARRTQQWGYDTGKIFELLQGYGYTWFSVTKNGTSHYFMSKGKYACENLIAVPKERLDVIEMVKEGGLTNANNICHS